MNKYSELKKEVNDLLNQIVIKLKDVKYMDFSERNEVHDRNNYYDEEPEYYTKPTKQELDSVYLSCIKEVCKDALEKDLESFSKSVGLDEEYYSSRCW